LSLDLLLLTEKEAESAKVEDFQTPQYRYSNTCSNCKMKENLVFYEKKNSILKLAFTHSMIL